MKRNKSLLTRSLAVALALVLALSGMSLGGSYVYAASTDTISVSEGEIVASNYRLTIGETDLLESGLIVGGTQNFSKPTEADNLISVDTDKKEVTVSNYQDSVSGKTWTPKSVNLVAGGAVVENITLSNGVGTYTYTGEAFSVEVTYEVKTTVDIATQEKMLSAAKYLKEGKAELDTIASNRGSLSSYHQANDYLVDLANGIDIGLVKPFTFETQAAADSAKFLGAQIEANGGKLLAFTMPGTYSNSASKTQYLMTNGVELHNTVVETYNHINNIWNDEVFELLQDPNSTYSIALKATDETAYNILTELIISGVESWLNNMSSVITGTWPEGQSADFLADTVDYAKLDTLVANLTTITDVTVSEELVAATAFVQKNMSMSNVTVKIVWNTVDENNEVTKFKEVTSDTVITLPDGTFKADILAAIKEVDAEGKAVAEWALDKDNYVATYSELLPELEGDVEYVVTYNPVEYTVTGDESVADVYPYGYTLTLPKHAESPAKVYDYKVDGTYYAEGSEYVIKGDVEITRAEGAARDTKTLLEIVLKDTALTSGERTVLTSDAVTAGNSTISIRYPSDSKVTLDENTGVVTAEKVLSDYPGAELYWEPTEAVVASGNTTKTYAMTDGKATITEDDYDKVTVVYTLTLSDQDAGAVKNVPYTLITEASDQLSKMAQLAAEETNMADVPYDILEMIKKYATGETLVQLNNILNNCYTKDQTKLDLYHYIVAYNGKATDAEKLVYYYQNREVMNDQLKVLVDALKVIKDDEAFKTQCIASLGNQASNAFSRLDDIEGKLDKIVLPAPNAAIDLTSTSLLALAEVLVNPATEVKEHASAALVLNHEIVKQASGRVTITVNMTQGANKASFSMTFKEGDEPDNAKFEEEYDKAFALLNITDATHYTKTGPSLAEMLVATSEDTTYDLVWTVNQYPVVIGGVDYGTVSINNKTITLPVHDKTAEGMEYVYTVAGVEYAQGETVSVDLAAVIGETLEITRKEINVKAEEEKAKYEDFKAQITAANGGAVKFAFEEDAEGEPTALVMEVAVGTTRGELMTAVTDFVMALTKQSYNAISLNGQVLYQGATVSVQTLVDAILSDANFNNEGMANALKNGAPLLTATMQLNSNAPAARSTELAVEKEFDFVVKFSGTRAQLEKAANALTRVEKYVSFQAKDDVLNVDVDLPEKVYEVYLTALLAVDQVNLDDINAVNTAIATTFLYDYVEGVLANESITTTTLQNTLEILDAEIKDKIPNYDLTQYEHRYQQLRTVLTEWATITETGDMPQLSIAAPAKTVIDRAIAAANANVGEGILSRIKEYENNTPIEATIVVNIVNTNEDFEALVLDLDALTEGLKEFGITRSAISGGVNDLKEKDVNGLKETAREIRSNITRDKLIALVKGQGVANAVDFTDDLAGRMTTVTGPAAIILLDDVNADVTFNATTAIDLNGKVINGNVTSNGKLYIFNSNIGDNARGGINGAVSGNVSITAGTYTANVASFLPEGYTVVNGVVQNKLYTIDVADGNLNIIVNADIIDEEVDSYVNYAKALAAELTLDIAMNYYTSAMLTANGNDIYGFTFDDYMGLIAGMNTAGEAVDLALECISLPGMAEFMNDVMADLLDFGAIQTALENGGIVASYDLEIAPWKLTVKRDTEGDYITGGLVADTANGNKGTITLSFKGSNSETTAKFFELLNKVVKEAEVKFVDVEDLTFENKHFNLAGGLEATFKADLSDYTTYMAIVIANSLEGDAQKAMVDAVNSGDEDAVKDVFDTITVNVVATALKVLERGDDFATLAKEVGINTNIDFGKNKELLEKAMMYTMAAIGRALEELEVTGGAQMLGNLDKDDDGVYDLAKAIGSKSKTFTRRGYGVNFTLAGVSGDVSVRLFGEEPIDCLWGDANHDGVVNTYDANLVLQYYVGKPVDICTVRTDVNQDGVINTRDANLILQYYVGKVTTFPYVED